MSDPVYGVTATGWYGKPEATIESEVDAGLQTILGEDSGTETDGTIPLRSKAGQLKVLIVDEYSELWDLGGAIYAAFNPNSATAAQLDSVCSLTGTLREGEQFSSVTAYCLGTYGTLLPVGRLATTTNSNIVYESTFAATINISPIDWEPSSSFLVGDIVFNSGSMYFCTGAGTSAVSGGPSGLGNAIVDGSCTWCFLGAAVDGVTCYVAVTFEAVAAGPVNALAGSLATITTPVAGWQSICNPLDGTPGAAVESDPALRARRDFEAASSGNATVDAIRAALLSLNQSSIDPTHVPLKSVTMLHNDGDVVDANGLPPHSFEAICYYGANDIPATDQDIANTIWATGGGGVATFGNQTSTVVDSQGDNQTVKWSKPDEVSIYVVFTVEFDPTIWTGSSAVALVEASAMSAFIGFAQGFPPSRSVRVAPLSASLFDSPSAVKTNPDGTFTPNLDPPATASSMSGITDVTPFYIGTSPSPVTGTAISIGVRQIAQFSSDNTTITATPEAP